MTMRNNQLETITHFFLLGLASLGVQNHLPLETHQKLVWLILHKQKCILSLLWNITVKPSLSYYNYSKDEYIDVPDPQARKYLTIECRTGFWYLQYNINAWHYAHLLKPTVLFTECSLSILPPVPSDALKGYDGEVFFNFISSQMFKLNVTDRPFQTKGMVQTTASCAISLQKWNWFLQI